MNSKDLIAAIAEQEQIPAGRVRKVLKALTARMALAVETGEPLQLPGLAFRPKTQAERAAVDDKPFRPERKVALIVPKKVKASAA